MFDVATIASHCFLFLSLASPLQALLTSHRCLDIFVQLPVMLGSRLADCREWAYAAYSFGTRSE